MQTTDIQPSDIRPITNHIFVEADVPNDRTESGLWIPDVSRQQSEDARGVDVGMGKGTIIAVGPGKRNKKGVRIPVNLQVGDRILYIRFSGRELDLGREYRLIQEWDVFALVDDDEDPRCHKHGWLCNHWAGHAGTCVPDLLLVMCPKCESPEVKDEGDGRNAYCEACGHEWQVDTSDLDLSDPDEADPSLQGGGR